MTQEVNASSVVLAGRGRRLAAAAIDSVMVLLFGLLLLLVTGALEHAEDYVGMRPVLSVLALAIASYLLLNGWTLWQRGQSLGKLWLGIKIVDATSGAAPPLWRLLTVRTLFSLALYLLLLGPAALLPVLDQLFIVRKDKRCLHDLLCGTTVVVVSGNSPITS